MLEIQQKRGPLQTFQVKLEYYFDINTESIKLVHILAAKS